MENSILKYFGEQLSPKQIQQFGAMKELYKEWNEKINVVSRKDIDSLYERHILHSLAIAKLHAFLPGEVIMDLGCGGGFPGIPLATLFPETQFKMVDSIGKKIKVVDAIAKELGLENVETFNARAESVDVKIDHIVSRAVTDLSTFLGWSWGKLDKGRDSSILYLKGGDLAEEITEGKRVIKNSGVISLFDINTFFEEEFFETKKIVKIIKK
ncbi:MAG: 16S rRNA (guanine(527)-N(7))-methyltransferase RsmG [Rikenellaceae bacterium]